MPFHLDQVVMKTSSSSFSFEKSLRALSKSPYNHYICNLLDRNCCDSDKLHSIYFCGGCVLVVRRLSLLFKSCSVVKCISLSVYSIAIWALFRFKKSTDCVRFLMNRLSAHVFKSFICLITIRFRTSRETIRLKFLNTARMMASSLIKLLKVYVHVKYHRQKNQQPHKISNWMHRGIHL